jgi:hypothetical protein
LSKKAVTCGPLACLRISPLLTWLVVAACRCCVGGGSIKCCRLLTSFFAFRSYQKCQIPSANLDLEFPAPACGALLPLAPIGARIQPLPFAPPSPFGRRPALDSAASCARHSFDSHRRRPRRCVMGGPGLLPTHRHPLGLAGCCSASPAPVRFLGLARLPPPLCVGYLVIHHILNK